MMNIWRLRQQVGQGGSGMALASKEKNKSQLLSSAPALEEIMVIYTDMLVTPFQCVSRDRGTLDIESVTLIASSRSSQS